MTVIGNEKKELLLCECARETDNKAKVLLLVFCIHTPVEKRQM